MVRLIGMRLVILVPRFVIILPVFRNILATLFNIYVKYAVDTKPFFVYTFSIMRQIMCKHFGTQIRTKYKNNSGLMFNGRIEFNVEVRSRSKNRKKKYILTKE